MLEARDGALGATFGRLSFEALTSFFVVTAAASRGDASQELDFVINAELIGAPADRRQRILAQLLTNRQELIQFFLLLLSGFGDTALGLPGAGRQGWGEARLFGSASLLEPMVRALARDPDRLNEIAGLIRELSKTDEGRKLLPDGWEAVWKPIWEARSAMVTQREGHDG